MTRLVCFLSQREHPTALALIRVGLSLVVLFDFAVVYHYDLVEPLWAPRNLGGFSEANAGWPDVYRWFGADISTTWLLYYTTIIAFVAFAVGLFTRLSGIIAVLSYGQTALLLGESDRGIDMLIRSVLVILICSGCGKSWSVDSFLFHGRFVRNEVLVPAWPRYLIILQLCWMYFLAGMLKQQAAWTFSGGFESLYHILRDPAYAMADFTWIPMWGTQLGTFLTISFERGFPILLIYYWGRNSGRPGPLRRLLVQMNFRAWLLALGVSFHILLMFSLRLGIFPVAMLATYPAFFRPSEIHTFFRSVRERIRPERADSRHAKVGSARVG